MLNKPTVKNNLYLSNPAVAKEWHPSKNGSLTPKDVTLIANRNVWWLCSKDHVWSATINDRIRGSGCPYCSGNKVEDKEIPQEPDRSRAIASHSAIKESPKSGDIRQQFPNKVSPEKCLQTVNPLLAEEWHPTKNGSLTPKDVTALSHNQVWWKCSKGHEWKSTVSNRMNGQGCFYCNYIHKGK